MADRVQEYTPERVWQTYHNLQADMDGHWDLLGHGIIADFLSQVLNIVPDLAPAAAWHEAVFQTLSSVDYGWPAVRAALKKVNGRRRVRILDEGNVFQVMNNARVHGWDWDAGERVSKSYGYTAVRTCCAAARRGDGTIRWGIAIGSAAPGSSPVTPVIPGFRRHKTNAEKELEQAREWAEAWRPIAIRL